MLVSPRRKFGTPSRRWSGRAPGPDGFTGLFYKTAWEIIKPDVVNVFNAFWSMDMRSLYLLNDATMVFLRKCPTPTKLGDYRPISLIHSIGKLMTKLLARRLAPKLLHMVSPNQSAFVKGRCLHDNFIAVQLTARWLHGRHHSCILLKVDIAKAFDSVSWEFLIEVLSHIGFPARWNDWISAIVSTASTRVSINGNLSRRICHARGLRQGDPLSPMLFVLAMESLNAFVRMADQRRLLSSLPGTVIKHRALLCADDFVMFVAPSRVDMLCVRAILDAFAAASGLVTNVDKCAISPIRCTEEQVLLVTQTFSCQVVPFPCRYLGVPLSLGRLSCADEQKLIDVVATRIPIWKFGLLTDAGRVLLTKVTLSAISVHISIMTCLSA